MVQRKLILSLQLALEMIGEIERIEWKMDSFVSLPNRRSNCCLLMQSLLNAKTTYGELTLQHQKNIATNLGIPLSHISGVVSFYDTLCDRIEPCSKLPAIEDKGENHFFLKNKKENQSIQDYGFRTLFDVLTNNIDPIAALETSDMRGRGGASFSIAKKWNIVRTIKNQDKYVICNGSEGELFTAKDYVLLTETPYAILEGMAICGYAVGANKGIICIRNGYEDTLEIIETAIKEAICCGFLGQNIFDRGFNFEIRVQQGAGAYISGEETALLEFLEGNRAEPRLKPPYPGIQGFLGKPTVINNVESFAVVPLVLGDSADAFLNCGTDKDHGTTLFSVSGCVKHPGVYEYQYGTTLRHIYEEAGGCPEGKYLKGVMIGGGSSGTIFNTSIMDVCMDSISCAESELQFGTGTLWFFDQETSVVELCKNSAYFFSENSCGKCTACRFGNHAALELLERLLNGNGSNEDIEELSKLERYIAECSLCGLGQLSPQPVLSALRNFYGEFEVLLSKGGKNYVE